ncbi:MAG: hypothetical protein ACFCD0_10995 [Gemmataceae bacterium]
MLVPIRLTFLITIAFCVSLTGCFNPPSNQQDKKGHHQHNPPPHGGLIIPWGADEYHVEFVRNKKTGMAKLYMYDGELEKLVPIDAKVISMRLKGKDRTHKLEFKPDPSKDDPKDQAPLFTLKHEVFQSKGKLKGTIDARFGGAAYSQKFDEAKPHRH